MRFGKKVLCDKYKNTTGNPKYKHKIGTPYVELTNYFKVCLLGDTSADDITLFTVNITWQEHYGVRYRHLAFNLNDEACELFYQGNLKYLKEIFAIWFLTVRNSYTSPMKNTSGIDKLKALNTELMQGFSNVDLNIDDTQVANNQVVNNNLPKPNSKGVFTYAMSQMFPLPAYKDLALHLNTVKYVEYVKEGASNFIDLSLVEPFYGQVRSKLKDLQNEIDKHYTSKVTIRLRNITKPVDNVAAFENEVKPVNFAAAMNKLAGIGKNANSGGNHFEIPSSLAEMTEKFLSLKTEAEVSAYESFLALKCYKMGVGTIQGIAAQCKLELSKK
jgi:hypothetical protein